MKRVAPLGFLLVVAFGCAGGMGADRPDWPPPATLSADGDDDGGARVDGDDDGDGAPADTETDALGETTTGETTTGEPTATADGEETDDGTWPPDLGAPQAETGSSGGTDAVPPSCADGSGACASCADLACCAAIEEAAADPEASCLSACMRQGIPLPACGSSCDTVDPFSEPGITDLFLCLSDACAGMCGSV
jgi:hypothetical protein